MDLGLFHNAVNLLNHVFVGSVALLVYISAEAQTNKLSERTRQALLGIIFGGTVVWSLLDPVVVVPGVLMTGAAPSIGLAGLFGGYVGGPIAAVLGIGMRIAFGNGMGPVGIANALGAMAAGLAVREVALRTTGRIGYPHVVLAALLIVPTSMASLLLFPAEKFWAVFPKMWPVIATIHPTGVLVLGGLLILEIRRREASKAFRERNRQFQAVVDNLPGTVYQMRMNEDGTLAYTFLSNVIRRTAGVTEDEAVANPRLVDGRFLPEEEEERRAYLRRSMETMQPGFREFRMRFVDGSLRWLRTYSTPSRDERGRYVWDGVTLDITEEKRQRESLQASHAALAESERRFRAIVENLPGLVFQSRLDKNGQMHFTYLSDRIRALGITPEQAIADYSLVRRTYLPEEEEARNRAIAESAKNLTPFNQSFRVRMPDGKAVWRHTYATPHRDASGDIVWDGVTVDINSSKELEQELRWSNARLEESERRFRTIADNLPGVVFQARRDRDGRLTYHYLSDGAKQVYGISAQEIMADAQVLRRVFFEEEEAERKQAVRESMANPTLRVRDFRVRHPDGTVRWMRSRAVPTPLPDGSTLWEGLTIDITDQKQMEDELRGAERLQALGQLTAGVAHQFNNLLMIISGNVEILAKEAAAMPQTQDPFNQIQNAISRGSDITLELQSFSRMQSLNREIRDIQDILMPLQALTRTVLGPEVHLDLRVDSPVPPVLIDGERLQNAILQLLLNGRDAMPSGGTLVIAAHSVKLDEDVAAEKGLTPGTYVEISVQDEGIGMNPETLAHAMDPFFTTKSVGQGKGLGLSTVHGFATQSGGRFELSSAEGLGTTATLLLPAAALDRPSVGANANLRIA